MPITRQVDARFALTDKGRYDPGSDAENAVAHGEPLAEPVAETVQSVVRRSLEQAVKHYKEHLEPEQNEATDYYHGRPFGDEEDGRSKVISTDVRDATLAQLPSLMDVFFGSERAVEFAPWGPEDVDAAEQKTDFVNQVVVQQDNRGYMTFMAWFQDALVRKIGVVKWWWDTMYRVEGASYSGLEAPHVVQLITDPSIVSWEITSVDGSPEGETYGVRVTRRREDGCARFEAVPPEEFVFTPNARHLGVAPMVAHVREVPRDELVALGIPWDVLERVKGSEAEDYDLTNSRQYHDSQDDEDRGDSVDASQQPVLFAEAYALVDGDGDGIAERRMFQCVGPTYEIVNGDGLGEVVDEVPFAVLCPYPEAHTVVGLSNHDLLKDVQKVKSQVLRSTLNSLALAVEPKMEVVVGEVNMKDLLSPDVNGIVRVQRPGQLREIGHTFVGPATLSMLDHYDRIKEDRTGHTRAAAGLDPDSLQSSTKAAVAATVSASGARLKWVARNFAETGVKDLFRGLLRLVVKNQRKSRTVRLRNKWVEVDPRHWDAESDVVVTVGLGSGTPEDRLNALGAIIDKQMALMQGGAPFVGWPQLRSSLARAAQMVGFRNPDEFFAPWGPEQEQMAAQQAQGQQPPPDPALLMVQVEAQKAQAQAQTDQMKAQHTMQMDAQRLMLEREKMLLDDDRQRDLGFRKLALEEAKIEAEFNVKIADIESSAEVEREKAEMQAEIQEKQATEPAE